MRVLLVLFITFVAGSAEAGSLLSSSARLLESPGLELFGIRQDASPSDEVLPPPPLLPAPGGEWSGEGPAPETSPEVAPQTLPPPMQYDPHAGGVSSSEILSAALMVLGADVLSLGIGLTTGILLGAANGGGMETLAAVVVGVLAGALADFVLVPFAAALGVYAVGDSDGAGAGFMGALAGAWAAHLGSIALYAGLALLISPLANGAAVDSYNALSSGIAVLALALHYIAIPVGASLGFHWNGGRGAAHHVDLGTSRRPEKFVVRPSDAPASAPAASFQVLALSF